MFFSTCDALGISVNPTPKRNLVFYVHIYRGEAEKSWLRHAAMDAKSSNKQKPGGRGGRGSRTDTAVDGCRNEMADRVARYPVRLISGACVLQ